ncbi:MAG: glutamate synthase subunit beta [Verrucomicrobia bacterium]|nr:glutamate synthase subunit beta [Verrucomicrobiota bacterium]
MGETGAFLRMNRKEAGYRPVEERVRDYAPVEVNLPYGELEAQAARCMNCGTPFCHSSGCPVVNLIPDFNELIYHGRWNEALDILLATNNFPEFTGRVCPAPCEAACVLAINREPVSIRNIELAIIEHAYENGMMRPFRPAQRYSESVAVIGSGPSGLAVADTLNKDGYNVTVFDKDRRPGGILRYGIPDFKLEKRVIDRRIALMKEEGVVFEMGVTVGEDVSFKFLKDRYDAICLSGGARQPRDLPAPGRDLAGIHFAMDFLKCQNLLNEGAEAPVEKRISAEGKSVIVIGGGDTGADCVGTAIRQKARRVLQFEIMPKPPGVRPESTPWPRWPNILRESSSHKEGCERRWSVSTKEFIGDAGRLKALDCVEVECGRDESGRLRFKEKPGSEFTVEAELVLLAMGFVGPGKNRLADDLGIERDSRGNIKVDPRYMTSVPGIFAAGDMSRGQSLVVRAIADGRRAAGNIAAYLRRNG